MSTIQSDFDRITLVSPDGSLHNDHYHNFLLRQLRSRCHSALEVGCGKGEFSRRLAERSDRVLALDLSPEMISIARERLAPLPNIDFELVDVMQRDLPAESFDCIASIATLHHLPLREILLKMKAALKPDGVLLILDLFEPRGLADTFLNPLAVGLSGTLRLVHHRRLLPSREARDAWAIHETHDLYPTMNDVRQLCADILPGASVRKHLLWRYSAVWRKN
ncbi:MAG TPA: class I SAM-dependent methyltransferase [Pyrinomonadaceae bacterium]|nr:class I SAM-dependent methyltransferase [Pyrinomonadaceae bacterium]